MSWEAHDLINKLLSRDPAQRPSPSELKAHPFFRGVDWENIRSQEAPFIPSPNDNTDTSYFDGNILRSCHALMFPTYFYRTCSDDIYKYISLTS